MGAKLIIKEISSSQVDLVVSIHSRALPDDVMPNLGEKLLQKYYRNVLLDKNHMLFGATISDELLGFCLVSTKYSGLRQVITSKRGLFESLKLMLLKPGIFYLGLMQAFKKSKIIDNTAEISYLAVDPSYQSRGAGYEMVLHANQWCYERGLSFLQTKTTNNSLRNFYLNRFDAKEMRQYKLSGRFYSELRWPTSMKT